MAPRPKLTVSEWADRNRVVSSYSAEPGPWVTSRTPYLREIMDAFSDPTVQMVAFQKCARIGGTEAGLNIVGYFIDQDPSPVLIVQPTVDDAKDFSKEQLAPMIADTACLAGKVKDPNSRDSGNTVLAKTFTGGGMFLVGANSPRGFRRRTSRVLDLEEIDAYPASAGTEGDQIKLALRRTQTFGYRRKVYMNSTPTLKGLSRIEDYALRGDQRYYEVPCLSCGHFEAWSWKNLKYEGMEEPAIACTACGVLSPEEAKYGMVAAGKWVARNPGAPHRSYYINALYSPWVSWKELVAEWIEAQSDVGKLQVFVNTVLGETWEDRGGGLEPGMLEQRPDRFDIFPADVGVLTMGVDVQDTRLEYSIVGWGQGEQSCVQHGIIHGDPTEKAVWAALEEVRRRSFDREDGSSLRITATCVDTGAHTQSAYDYCRPRFAQRVYAVKGSSTPGTPMVPRRPTRNNKGKVALYLIGTDAAKDLWYGRLKLRNPGPGYVRFHMELPSEWFLQVTSERLVKKQINGRWRRAYELPRGARNEALDCLVYAIVALYLAPVNRLKLGQLAAKITPPEPPPSDPEPEPLAALVPPPVQRAAPRRRGWVGKW